MKIFLLKIIIVINYIVEVMYMKFVTIGEKIKETRKYLKMTQEDLQDESISRGMISMLEINARGLTKVTATKLAQKFNQKSKELDIKFEIDENFLLRFPAEDAEVYCLKKLDNSNINNNIEEVFEIANEFNLLKVKAAYFSKKADFCMTKKDYDEAFIKYNDAITIYKDTKLDKMTPHLYLQIGLCKARSSKYKDALTYFDICERYSILYKDTITKQLVLYDMALCYKKINKLDLALESIERYLLSSKKEEDMYVYATILKANCYEAIGKYDIVIEIYSSLLADIPKGDNIFLGYIYNNMGLVYVDKTDFKTSLKYFEMAEKVRNIIDAPNLCHTLIEKSDLFLKQKFYNEAIKTIELGLMDAEIYKDYEYLIKGNYSLLRIYETIDDTANLKKVYLKIADLLKINNNISELTSIYVKLALIYLNENNIEEAKVCLILSQKLKE